MQISVLEIALHIILEISVLEIVVLVVEVLHLRLFVGRMMQTWRLILALSWRVRGVRHVRLLILILVILLMLVVVLLRLRPKPMTSISKIEIRHIFCRLERMIPIDAVVPLTAPATWVVAVVVAVSVAAIRAGWITIWPAWWSVMCSLTENVHPCAILISWG